VQHDVGILGGQARAPMFELFKLFNSRISNSNRRRSGGWLWNPISMIPKFHKRGFHKKGLSIFTKSEVLAYCIQIFAWALVRVKFNLIKGENKRTHQTVVCRDTFLNTVLDRAEQVGVRKKTAANIVD
jgi:hypothetical protein